MPGWPNWLGLIALVCVVSFGAGVWQGGASARAHAKLEAAETSAAAAETQAEVDASMTRLREANAALRQQLAMEAADGRAEILAEVGADQMVDPRFACTLFRRIERVRGEPQRSCGGSAAADPSE